jgi:hypothetical protein
MEEEDDDDDENLEEICNRIPRHDMVNNNGRFQRKNR